MGRRSIYLMLSILIFATVIRAEEDALTLDGQGPMDVIVQRETDRIIEFRNTSNNVMQTIDVGKVKRLVRKDAPPVYRQAMQYLNAGDYPRALKRFSDAKKTMKKTLGNWHEAYLDYYIAYCLYESSKKNREYVKNAKELLVKFTKDHPKHRFSGLAKYYTGLIYISEKQYDNAKKVFESLKANASRKDLRLASSYGIARVHYEQKDLKGALDVSYKSFKEKVFSNDLIRLTKRILLEDQKAFDEAFKIGKLLVGGTDSTMKLEAYELLAIAETKLKKWESGFIHFLKAELIHSSRRHKLSNEAKLNMLICLKHLMKENPVEYPPWEFKNYFNVNYNNLSPERKKIITNLKH